MRMKQIHAADMADAMRTARDELGEDAVLLDTKKVAGAGLIVTFAVPERDPVSFDDLFDDEADGYADEGYDDAPAIPRAVSARAEIDHPAYELVREVLAHHQLPELLNERLMRRLKQVNFMPGALVDVAEAVLAEILQAELVFAPIGTNTRVPERALMLVGTHGAGKTSAIAKLATELTLNKQQVAIISCDNERMGATDTLAGLCALLKCDFHVAEDRAAIKPILKQYEGRAWVLIDSTGINIYEFQQLKALGEIAGLSAVEPILTCPAGMDAAEATEMAGVLDFLSIERMIATKIDATRRLSSIFAAVSAGGLALANISSSAKPTQACSPASSAALARLMLRHVRERLHA